MSCSFEAFLSPAGTSIHCVQFEEHLSEVASIPRSQQSVKILSAPRFYKVLDFCAPIWGLGTKLLSISPFHVLAFLIEPDTTHVLATDSRFDFQRSFRSLSVSVFLLEDKSSI